MPAHPAFLALLDALAFPLAAPSANRSNRISPTRAEHVLQELSGRIPLVLDGGPASVGVESTIVAVDEDGGVRLLRPGGVAAEAIAAVIGARPRAAETTKQVAPGMGAVHYAPQHPLVLAARDEVPALPPGAHETVGLLLMRGPASCPPAWKPALDAARLVVFSLADDGDGREAARQLFASLRALDEAAIAVIVVERPDDAAQGAWPAVRDRLRRAAAATAGRHGSGS